MQLESKDGYKIPLSKIYIYIYIPTSKTKIPPVFIDGFLPPFFLAILDLQKKGDFGKRTTPFF